MLAISSASIANLLKVDSLKFRTGIYFRKFRTDKDEENLAVPEVGITCEGPAI